MRYHADDPELEEFYAEIDQLHLQPLWEMRGLLTPTPRSVSTTTIRRSHSRNTRSLVSSWQLDARPLPDRGATCGTPQMTLSSPCAIGCSDCAPPMTTATWIGCTQLATQPPHDLYALTRTKGLT